MRPAAGWTLQWANNQPFGLLHLITVPPPVQFALGVLLLDLSFYYWHVANHRIPFLWRFHNVHHIDPDLDVTTAFRFHFGEVAMSVVFRVLQVALIGVPAVLFAAYEVIFQANTAFHHSNVRLPIGLERSLNKLFVTCTGFTIPRYNTKRIPIMVSSSLGGTGCIALLDSMYPKRTSLSAWLGIRSPETTGCGTRSRCLFANNVIIGAGRMAQKSSGFRAGRAASPRGWPNKPLRQESGTQSNHSGRRFSSSAAVSARYSQAAQHDSFATSLLKVCAASLIPSERVRYGWNAELRSSIVSPNLIASAGSVIISPASLARIWAPVIFRVAARS